MKQKSAPTKKSPMKKHLYASAHLLLGITALQASCAFAAPVGTVVSDQAELEATNGIINATEQRAIVVIGQSIDYQSPVNITIDGAAPEITNYPNPPSGFISIGHHAAVTSYNAPKFELGTTTLNYTAQTQKRNAIGIRLSMKGSTSDIHTASLGANSIINVSADIQSDMVTNNVTGLEMYADNNDAAGQKGRGNIVTIGENLQITATNTGSGGAVGIEIYSSTLNLQGDTTIHATALGTNGNNAYGIYTRADTHINVNGKLNIVSQSDGNSIGVGFIASSDLTTNELNIDVSGQYTAVGVISERDTTITFAKSHITATQGGQAGAGDVFKALAGGQINATEGQHILTGNMLAHRNTSAPFPGTDTSRINVDFGAGSVFTGHTTINGDAAINFDMLGATKWNMTGNSQVTKLTFNAAGSNVNFVGLGGYNTLTIENLSGTGGQFNMRTDIVGNQGDLLDITGVVSGSHNVTVANNGNLNATGNEVLTIITTTNTNAQDYFTLNRTVELGGFEYNLKPLDGTPEHLALMATGKISNPSEGGINLFSGKYILGYTEMQTLMKRMGDLRDNPDKGNVWIRFNGGKHEPKAESGLEPFDLKHYGFQMGADRKITRDNAIQYAGGFIGYTNGSLDYARGGNGEINSYNLGGYFTHIHNNGVYIDGVLKYNWMKSDFDVTDSAGTRVIADHIDSNAFSASIEIGRRYHFDRDTTEGWYIEPQAQLVLTHNQGDNFNASNGLRVKIDSIDSQMLRAGAHLGYEVKTGNTPLNIYAKISHLKEFDGDIHYSLNDTRGKVSYEDNWWVYGAGITARLKNKHHLYMDIERSTGSRMKQNWGINLGYRYTW